MIKKIGLFIAIILFIGMQYSEAQTKAFRFGFKISPTVSWLKVNTEGYESNGSAGGFGWGLLTDISLTDNYFIKTGVGMSFLNGNLIFKDDYEYTDDNQEQTSYGATIERKYLTKYLEIPLIIKMKTNQFGKLSYFGEFGLETGIRLSAKGNDRVSPANAELKSFDYSKNLSDIKEVNLFKETLIFGAGVEYYIDESTSLIGGMQFGNGITDVLRGKNSYSDKDRNAMFHYFQFTIGVMF